MRPTRRLSGFTLVELMITLLIAAILLGLAVPGFTAFIRSNRAEVQVQSLVNSLNYARSEAVKRGQQVQITSLGGANWQGGWRIWVDRNGNSTFEAANDDEVQVVPAFSGEATLAAGVLTQVAFNSQGYNASSGVSTTTSTDFAYRVGDEYCRLERDVSINHLGRVSVARRVCP